MQLTVAQPCTPSRPVPVLQIHGTTDTCWPYDGGTPSCAGGLTGQRDKAHVSLQRTLDEWAAIDACTGDPTAEPMPNDTDDDQTSVRLTYSGCAADVAHIRIDGGGHTWPNGEQYFLDVAVGKVTRDWGNEVLLDWFDGHPK
jgi:polyhydroxybutyrate depolymerase